MKNLIYALQMAGLLIADIYLALFLKKQLKKMFLDVYFLFKPEKGKTYFENLTLRKQEEWDLMIEKYKKEKM